MVFRKVDEKTLGSETQNSLAGRLVEWCPTMDLLAFVTRDNNIAIHRLTWAKLHTFTENTSTVTSLAWSPDGKALASGHENGKITIYDIEVGEQTACVPAHSAPVTALSWVMWGGANAENAEMMEDRTNQFIPPLIPLPENSSSVRTSVRLADAKRPSVLTVLFSGDATGVVAMRGLGTFCIGLCQTCITSSSGNTRAQVRRITVQKDLSNVAVLLESTGEELYVRDSSALLAAQSFEGSGPRAGAGFCILVDSGVLAGNAPQLLQIASQAWLLECIFHALGLLLAEMRQSWKDAWEIMRGKLSQLEKGLRDHGSDNTAVGELLTCVASGFASAPLQAFVTGIGENGVRRWEKSVDAGCQQVQQQAVLKMLPLIQSLLFRAGELQGLARWEERFEAVGLSQTECEALTRNATALMHRVMEVGAAAQDFQRGISRMCHWLERLAGRLISESASSPALSPDEALSVARFISSQLESDRIAALLNAPISGADPPQLPVPPDERSASHALIDALRPPDAWRGAPLLERARVPLSEQLDRARVASERALGGTRASISARLAVDASLQLYPATARGADEGTPRALASSAGDGPDVELLVATSRGWGAHQDAEPAAAVSLLRLRRVGGEHNSRGQTGPDLLRSVEGNSLGWSVEQAQVLVGAGVEGSVVGVQFYGQDKVAAVSHAGEEAALTLLLQSQLEWEAVPPNAGESGPLAFAPLAPAQQSGALVRLLPDCAPVALAVTGKRGLAAVLMEDPWRLSLWDMEDEEEDEGDATLDESGLSRGSKGEGDDSMDQS